MRVWPLCLLLCACAAQDQPTAVEFLIPDELHVWGTSGESSGAGGIARVGSPLGYDTFEDSEQWAVGLGFTWHLTAPTRHELERGRQLAQVVAELRAIRAELNPPPEPIDAGALIDAVTDAVEDAAEPVSPLGALFPWLPPVSEWPAADPDPEPEPALPPPEDGGWTPAGIARMVGAITALVAAVGAALAGWIRWKSGQEGPFDRIDRHDEDGGAAG